LRGLLPENLEWQLVKVLPTMVESKRTFFQMQVKRLLVDPAESGELSFGIPPKPFNAVHMGTPAHKSILSIIDTQMFAVPYIDQAIIAVPPIRINHAVRGHFATNNCLQRVFAAVRHKFGIDLSIALKQPKYDCFAGGPTAAFPFYLYRTSVKV